MQRTNTISSKPEYVLKRANDLIKTAYANNADREKKLALEQLHNVISNKRKGASWTKIHEEVMKRHIELCVDLKDHRLVKDGLHQYRNLCQNVEPISLEYVINHLIEISERKTNEARSKADKVALAAAAKVADLDQEESPESVLLSSMTDEASKQRTDREVVVPWLKFLWETYRTILELLHKNTKYDRLYHRTCEKAFKFCEEYKRNLEFRRLCDILRTHLSNLQKLTLTTNRANKVVFEWTHEVIDTHLKTRLDQLEVATTLEQWNEAFRIVEDIYFIMTAAKKAPKPKVMAMYYEKLTRIFWVSGNYLFHAYAWFKYYNLIVEHRKDLKPEDKALLASNVLLSALIIPAFHEIDATTAAATTVSAEVDDQVIEKNQQMAMLLDFQANPTRQNLLADITAKGIHRDVLQDLVTLHRTIELDFKPLTLPTLITPILLIIAEHPSLQIYTVPLQQVAILRVVQQLSRVYSSIKIQRVRDVLSPFTSFTYTQIEKLMIDGVVNKQLHVRIDHVNQCLRFGSIAAAQQAAEGQVVQLGTNLNKAVFKLNDSLKKPVDLCDEVQSRQDYLTLCATSSHDYYLKSLERKGLIDELKQAIELAQQRREESDRLRKEEVERLRLDEMKRQLDIERSERERQRQLQDDLRKECERLAAEIERYNSSADVEDLLKLDANARQALLTKAKSDFLKARDEQQRKLVEQAKRLDFITRAQRIEIGKVALDNYNKLKITDFNLYTEIKLKTLSDLQAQHAADLIEKTRFARMQRFREPFEGKFVPQQLQDFSAYRESLAVQALQDYREAKLARARYLQAKELEKLRLEAEHERQRLAKEESDRLLKEQEEKLRRIRFEEEELQRERDVEEQNKIGRYSGSGAIPRGMTSGSPLPVVSRGDEATNWRGQVKLPSTSGPGDSAPEGDWKPVQQRSNRDRDHVMSRDVPREGVSRVEKEISGDDSSNWRSKSTVPPAVSPSVIAQLPNSSAPEGISRVPERATPVMEVGGVKFKPRTNLDKFAELGSSDKKTFRIQTGSSSGSGGERAVGGFTSGGNRNFGAERGGGFNDSRSGGFGDNRGGGGFGDNRGGSGDSRGGGGFGGADRSGGFRGANVNDESWGSRGADRRMDNNRGSGINTNKTSGDAESENWSRSKK